MLFSGGFRGVVIGFHLTSNRLSNLCISVARAPLPRRYFETLLRGKQPNLNKLMEGVHLKRFDDEMHLQAQQANDDEAIENRALAAARTTYRNELLDKMASGRGEKASRLKHDMAVHKSLLKHKEYLEKAELRIELVLAEKTKRKQLDTRVNTNNEVNDGIDAFEMNLKRFGGDTGGADVPYEPTGGAAASPYEHMSRMQALAPQMTKTLEGESSRRAEGLNVNWSCRPTLCSPSLILCHACPAPIVHASAVLQASAWRLLAQRSRGQQREGPVAVCSCRRPCCCPQPLHKQAFTPIADYILSVFVRCTLFRPHGRGSLFPVLCAP